MNTRPPFLAVARTLSLALFGCLLIPVGTQAQGKGGTVFERRDECVAAGALSAQQCDFAYRNARAEYDQKVPRYGTRGQCERRHGACAAQLVATGWDSFGKGGKGGASYVPRFAGVRIIGAGANLKALPALAGRGTVTAFAARPVGELQDGVAGRAAVIGVASRSRGGGSRNPAATGPRHGDRDDTMPVPMEQKRIGADAAPGLYVDPDGVEWYKPARRR